MATWGRQAVVLGFGILVGGWLFDDTQPRSLLKIGNACGATCARFSDIAGLAASVGIQHIPQAMPLAVKENATCIAIRHPYSPHRYHFVFFPKRDIRNVGDIAAGDEPFVMGCLALMRMLITEHGLVSYRMYSNGPLEQDITYLHFHLVSD
ncbi:MAG: hypothetical protein EKK46_13875 [Rhodocyclaceae bacterium]|nr:MAG: hypothetical protein EKK46_13875 [Rhodocyclaceae bacterium]